MRKLTLPSHPREATQKVLKLLSSPRLREVMERRFGLRSRDSETLEAIGQSWGVTRERVRQIEADALRHLSHPEVSSALALVFQTLEDHFSHHGHVFQEAKLLSSTAEPRFSNHVYFLLTIGKPFERQAEDEEWHDRWYTRPDALRAAEAILTKTTLEVGGVKRPVAARHLFELLKVKAKDVLGSAPHPDALESYLAISKRIRQNPYGEFGLAEWPTINPKGVRDKAYAALDKAGKPLHFREVAQAINRAGWSSRRAHPQTVHNELIKDNRFVLVGRGLYALREWGYEPGTVSEVIASILRNTRRPLTKDEVVKKVLATRFVKENTILLNLQNKNLFTRTSEGYTLV